MLFLVLLSCGNSKKIDFKLKEINFSTEIIFSQQLSEPIHKFSMVSGDVVDSTLHIYYAEIPNASLSHLSYNFLSDSLIFKKRSFEMLETDRATFFAASYIKDFKSILVFREPKFSGFNYDSVFYLINDKNFSAIEMEVTEKFHIGKNRDSSKFTLFPRFQPVCVVGPDIFVEIEPRRFSLRNQELRQKYNMPDLIKINSISGKVSEVFNVFEFGNLDARFNYNESHVFLTPNPLNNQVLITYGNDFRFWVYDIEKDTTTLVESVKFENQNNLFGTNEDVEVGFFEPKPIFIENKLHYIRRFVFINNGKVSSKIKQQISARTNSYFVYNSQLELISMINLPDVNLRTIFSANGINYLPMISDDNIFSLETVTFNLTNHQIENVDGKIDSLYHWASSFKKIAPLDFSKYDLPKEATVVLMPKNGCPSCVQSNINAIIENKDVFRENVFFLYSKEVLSMYAINSSKLDSLSTNIICIADQNYDDLLPYEMEDFWIIQLENKKVQTHSIFTNASQIWDLRKE